MGNPIDERLMAPVRELRIDELPRLWHHIEISAVCPTPPIETTRLDLLHKVRGALGDQLLAGASQAARRREPCDWDPPCALDVLFRRRSIPGLKAGAPSPFVLSADAGPEELTIRLAVFGMAEPCAAEAGDALVRGLRAGLSLGDGWRIGLKPRRRQMHAIASIERQPPAGAELSLVFETPLATRSDGRPAAGPGSVLRGMFDRVIGLARWYGIEVAGAPDWLHQRLAGITIDGSGLAAEEDRFRPSLQALRGGYAISPRGGALRLTSDWLSLWPLLAIGEVVHAGGRATDGYGRFRLIPG